MKIHVYIYIYVDFLICLFHDLIMQGKKGNWVALRISAQQKLI